jgi:hypothetical protein
MTASTTTDDLWDRCMRAYHAADPVQLADRRTRWVMDLDHYKQIRAVSEAYKEPEHRTDPETWVPDPGDRLCMIPIDVRDDGGEPHLETPPIWPAAYLIGPMLVMPVSRTVTAEEWNSITWPPCPKCGATLIVDRLEVTFIHQRIAHYLPGRVACPNECDWRHETEIRNEP